MMTVDDMSSREIEDALAAFRRHRDRIDYLLGRPVARVIERIVRDYVDAMHDLIAKFGPAEEVTINQDFPGLSKADTDWLNTLLERR